MKSLQYVLIIIAFLNTNLTTCSYRGYYQPNRPDKSASKKRSDQIFDENTAKARQRNSYNVNDKLQKNPTPPKDQALIPGTPAYAKAKNNQ